MSNEEELTLEYRRLYWERNEAQLVLPDVPDPAWVEAVVIEPLNKRMTEIETQLGYLPAA